MAVGSIVATRAPRGLAVTIIAALICGEAFNLLSTAERIIAVRETAASSIKGANDKHTAASARLARVEAAQTAQRGTAAKAVALPSCAKECRALLENQAAALIAEITEARSAVDAAPVERSTTPLADRLGWSPWALDLLAAALLSIGANGLAAVLIAFGARPGPRS